MKMNRFNVLYFLIVMASMVLFSCGSDDDDFTGTYIIKSYTLTGCNDPMNNISIGVNSDNGCSTILGVEVCGSGSITIRENETFSLSVDVTAGGQTFSTTGEGTYSISGNTLTVCDETECFDGTIDGNTVQIAVPDEDGCTLTLTGEKQ